MTGAELMAKLKELAPDECLEDCTTCMFGDLDTTDSPCSYCIYEVVTGYSEYQPDMELFDEMEGYIDERKIMLNM